jgi:hypothetical protein
MSFWTKLFGASEIVDKVSSGVDAAFFTPEERAKHYLEVLKNIEPFKIAQRWLAVIIIVPYVAVWLLCAVMFALSGFVDGMSGLMEISDKLAERNNDNLGMPVAIIVAFYYGGGAVEGVVAKFKK